MISSEVEGVVARFLPDVKPCAQVDPPAVVSFDSSVVDGIVELRIQIDAFGLRGDLDLMKHDELTLLEFFLAVK